MVTNLLTHPVESILQQAIGAELHASHLYKHLANQCQRLGLFGAAKYFRHESAEELEHYQGIADFMNDRGSVADLPELDAVDDAVTGLLDAVKIAYKAEVELGENYAKWYKVADPITQQFLLKYLEIQAKAIGSYGDLLARLNLAGDDACAIIVIDKDLAGA